MSVRLGFASALAVAAALVFAGSAQASVTLGPNLSIQGLAGAPCAFADGCTLGLTGAPGGTVVAPFDGVIVGWRFKGDGDVTLRVLHPTAANAATGAGTGPTLTGAGCGTVVEGPARLAIKAGEIVGNDSFGSAGVCGTPVPVAGGGYIFWNPLLQDGQNRSGSASMRELAQQADVEPDVDQDVFGDESQDNCVGTAGSVAGCPSTVAIDAVAQQGKRSVTVTVTVPGQGKLTAGATGDPALAASAAQIPLTPATQAITAKSRQQIPLTLALTTPARKKLKKRRKLSLQVQATYTPTGGPPASQVTQAKLRLKKKKKRH